LLAGALLPLPALSQTQSPVVLVQSESPGWYDLSFAILDEQPILEDGKRIAIALRIGGTLGDQRIELGLAIPDDWEEAKLTPPLPIKSFASSVLFARVGKSSDRFVRALATIYRQPNPELMAREELEVDVIALAQDPRPIGSKPINAKAFVHGKTENDYGEFYLNVDWGSRRVILKEKDPEYRFAIINALSAGGR